MSWAAPSNEQPRLAQPRVARLSHWHRVGSIEVVLAVSAGELTQPMVLASNATPRPSAEELLAVGGCLGWSTFGNRLSSGDGRAPLNALAFTEAVYSDSPERVFFHLIELATAAEHR